MDKTKDQAVENAVRDEAEAERETSRPQIRLSKRSSAVRCANA